MVVVTYEVVSGDDDTTHEEDSGSDPVMGTKDHIIDHGFVDQVADFDKARYGRNHSKDAHFGKSAKISANLY